ncbi:unnamed protein product [Malus baccata var. baccata]
MERYFKRKSTKDNLSPFTTDIPKSSNENNIESILANLPGDPGLQLWISEYDPNIRDQLEIPDQAGNDNFTGKGFHNLKKKCQLRVHVGGPNSAHNQALLHCEALMNQNQHSQTIVHKQSDQARIGYRTRLAFRGHDKSEDSSNKGNFLELLKFLADHNVGIKDVMFKNAPQNLKLTSHDIQTDIVYVVACETTNAIMFDIGDDTFFSVLVDELHDIPVKEQMIVVLRYVNTNGQVVERFVSIKHVPNTTGFSLKDAIDQLFSINGLNISRLRRQGYDGASNTQEILGITSVLSQTLQKIDLDIASVMALVKACKQQLQAIRDNGWDHDIDIPDIFIARGRSRRRVENLTNLHHYRVDLFIDIKRDRQYPLVYLLVKLALILLVATALDERAFSMMKIVKNPHHNWMTDQRLYDSFVVYIKKENMGFVSKLLRILGFRIGIPIGLLMPNEVELSSLLKSL